MENRTFLKVLKFKKKNGGFYYLYNFIFKKFSKNYQFITKIEKLDFDLHERKF